MVLTAVKVFLEDVKCVYENLFWCKEHLNVNLEISVQTGHNRYKPQKKYIYMSRKYILSVRLPCDAEVQELPSVLFKVFCLRLRKLVCCSTAPELSGELRATLESDGRTLRFSRFSTLFL